MDHPNWSRQRQGCGRLTVQCSRPGQSGHANIGRVWQMWRWGAGLAESRPHIAQHVHAPAAADAPVLRERRRPLVYVYDMPPEFNGRMIQVAALKRCPQLEHVKSSAYRRWRAILSTKPPYCQSARRIALHDVPCHANAYIIYAYHLHTQHRFFAAARSTAMTRSTAFGESLTSTMSATHSRASTWRRPPCTRCSCR